MRTAASRAGSLFPQHPSSPRSIQGSSEWLFEPYWHGERLLAFVDRGLVFLTDVAGERVEQRLPEAARGLSASVTADQAIVDGIWAVEGPAAGPESVENCFIAVDLLELDGQELFDVPLLERRRLLESVITENARVRVTPAVRPPIDASVSVWRALGFAFYVAKHANSRYLPGERNPDWVQMSARRPRQVGLIGGLLGQRSREHRIED